MPDDPTTPALPPFLGGRVYTATNARGVQHWRRDLTAEPKLHRLLAHVWASFDDGFINIDALHLLDELVGGPPTWLSTTEPEPPPEDWQHAASVEGPRGLVQFVHKGEEASRAALAKLVNSASVFVTRPLSAGPTLDDEDTQEDLDDVGGMVVETDPVEACLDMVSEAIEGLVGPGVTPSLSGGQALDPFVLVLGPVVVTCSAPKGGALARSLLYVAEAIGSTRGEAPPAELAPGTLLFDWGLANAPVAPPSLAAALKDPAWLNEGLASGESVTAAAARSEAIRASMTTPAATATDVPTVILPEMPPIVVRWLVVDKHGECVCYVLAGSEDDARRKAEEEGAVDDFRISPDPYMLDDWEEDKPLLEDEGALIHARRRHLTWKLMDAMKRRKASGALDGDTGIWCWTGVDGLLNPNDVKSGELIKLLWDRQWDSPDEALLAVGPVLQRIAQAQGTVRFSYHPAYDGKLQIGDTVIWVGMEFHDVARCLLLLTQACVDPSFRLPDEIPASEVPTVELPAPPVTDMADAIGLADEEEAAPAVLNCDGYTMIGRVATTSSTALWRMPHKRQDMLEITHRISGDVLREALGISLDDLMKKRQRDVAERTLDNVLLCLKPAPGFEEDVTVNESEDGKVCVSLQGRALVAADEEGAKVLRALGELFKTRTIPY